MNDERIIELFFSRDERALKAVEEKYGGLCFTIADNILNDRTDAEECVNDTYLAAWNSIPPEKPQSLTAYLARIARNKALNRYERKKSQRRNSDLVTLMSELSEDIPERDKTGELLDAHFVSEMINKYLQSVSKTKAAIFVQRYFLCCSIEEISTASGYSYNKIAVTLHRMRSELRKILKEEGVDI